MRLQACVLVMTALLGPPQEPTTDSFEGFWKGELVAPDMPEPIALELLLEVREDHTLHGSLAVPYDHSPIVGELLPDVGEVRFESDFDDDELLTVELRLSESGELEGTARRGSLLATVRLRRSDDEPAFHHHSGFEFPEVRPITVHASELDPELELLIMEPVLAEVEARNAVALSIAVVAGGEIVDARSIGWEDVAGGIEASDRTMYRWASISKPMTAVVALQLVERGRLDLDQDVRSYVPEFPEKPHSITSRQLLNHRGGIVHYSNGPVVATEREYDVEHPWADTILCLDRFRESPLISTPGTEFDYTTHGYMLLGAVVQRAGEDTYAAQVTARVADPLGMTSLQPDYPWIEIEHRAIGYRGLRIGLATLDEDRDVCWKLPGGGWISTITDLARFALALLETELLEPETQAEMFAPRSLPDGSGTGYGYGIGVSTFRGHGVVSHSGRQSKASTYLMLVPARDLGVVVMSNTSNFGTRRVAQLVMEALLQE